MTLLASGSSALRFEAFSVGLAINDEMTSLPERLIRGLLRSIVKIFYSAAISSYSLERMRGFSTSRLNLESEAAGDVLREIQTFVGTI